MKVIKYIVILFLLLTPFIGFSQALPTINMTTIKEHPLAVGHGKNVTGGRGEPVYIVSNFNENGANSLNAAFDAAETNGGGNIVFRSGGTYTLLDDDLWVRGDNLTVYGQSASGTGIQIYGNETVVRGENIAFHHMRFKHGDPGRPVPTGTGEDTFRIMDSGQTGTHTGYMINNCSFAWGGDETIAIETGLTGNVTVQNVTFQNCIISESFNDKNHINYGENILNVSSIRNFYTNSLERSYRASAGAGTNTMEFINNFIYGYVAAALPTVRHEVDFIGNVYEDAYASMGWYSQPPNTEPLAKEYSLFQFADCSTANCPPSGDTNATGSKVYAADNSYNGNYTTTVEGNKTYTIVRTSSLPYVVGSRQVSSGYTPLSAVQAKTKVLETAGAFPRDSYDANQIAKAQNDTGVWGDFVYQESETTGLPTMTAGTPYTDNNLNGIDDDFETEHGITNQTDVIATYVFDGEYIINNPGYTALEVFMHKRAGYYDKMVNEEEVSDGTWTIIDSPTPTPDDIIKPNEIYKLRSGGERLKLIKN